jgi:hypothetical protein
MGHCTDANEVTWKVYFKQWTQVRATGGKNGLERLMYEHHTQKNYLHPNYSSMVQWCNGPMIAGRFIPRDHGGFYFEDGRDAAAFKLTWG